MPTHSGLADSELHNPKGFAGASNSTKMTKDASGNLVWASDVVSTIDSASSPHGAVLTSTGDDSSAFSELVWKDLLGEIGDRSGGVAPNARAYRGGVFQYSFNAGEEFFLNFHVPHDWAVGTDLYIHVHWSHITAATTSTGPDFIYDVTYSKGHNQADFPAPIVINHTGTSSVGQYRHIVDEIQLSAASPSASQLDTDDIEVDGVILVNFEVDALPTGVTVNDFFVHFIDIHYQADVIGTKNKAPNFYT